MIVTFSRHAQQMLQEREISEKTVREVVNKPAKVIDRADGTKIAQKQLRWQSKNVLCRVVYRLTSREAARVITAYITTKIDKY